MPKPHRGCRQALLFGCAAVATLVCMVGAGITSSSQAALPAPKKVLVAYDHSSQATGFHLQIVVGGSPRLISTASIVSFKCRVEPLAKNVPVSDAGGVDIHQAFAPRRSRPGIKSGNFIVNAQFRSPTELSGKYQVSMPGCDSGVRSFTAVAGGDQHAGTAAAAHRHAGHAGHELQPDITDATPAQRAQAEALWAASKQAASRFPTIVDALKAGFTPQPGFEARVRRLALPIFHLENFNNWTDDHVLDPSRPESLVYWYPPDRPPTLVAFMYRASGYRLPPTIGGPIIRWHMHGHGPTQMAHVWFANTLQDAFAAFSSPPRSVFARVSPSLATVAQRRAKAAHRTKRRFWDSRGYLWGVQARLAVQERQFGRLLATDVSQLTAP